MSDVRILPEIISNRIAAGEVVERPVSIVKELVENSLDAGATRITIDIKRGGRDLVRVSDNGEGMTRDNALLSIERYATSKIFSNDDLFSIKSFGFRGEALPSIASVSKFTLITRDKGADSGTRIFINGGKLMDVSEVGAPLGTEIEVKNLFFNTPVRRKFLKSINTEMGHIGDVFSGMALGNPGIGFRLLHNSRLIKSFLPSDDMLKRAGEVFGNETAKNFCHIFVKDHDVHIKGYVSNPSLTRSTSRSIRLFVNNRMISDSGLVSAIFRGFKGRIMKGRFPMAVLFISLPFDEVDVNVHPAKLQVRFAHQNYLYSVVADAVHDALCSDGNRILINNNDDEKIETISHYIKFKETDNQKKSRLAETLFKWGGSGRTAVHSDEFFGKDVLHEDRKTEDRNLFKPDSEKSEQKLELKSDQKPQQKLVQSSVKSAKVSVQPQNWQTDKQTAQQIEQQPGRQSDSFHIVGQVFGTYIVIESGKEMVLIDQHAAHERIVYEKLKKRAKSFNPPSQSLIVPETLELGFREANLLEKITGDLASLGIIVEPFGGTSFIVKSVPAIIDNREISPLIREMLDRIIESGIDTGDDSHKSKWLDDVIVLMACHSAIRANYNLNIREMEKLISDLERCENPFNCPHGRPTRIRWSRTEIEKLFKRIV